MAYYVFSSIDASLGPGPLMIRAGRLGRQRRADDRLDGRGTRGRAARRLHGEGDRRIQAVPRRLAAAPAGDQRRRSPAFLLTAEIFGLGLDYDVRLPGLVQAVTLDAANEAARRLLDPARATIAVAGPWADHEAHEARQDDGRSSSTSTSPSSTPARCSRARATSVSAPCTASRCEPAAFERAVAASSAILDEVEEPVYDDEMFVDYTASIIEHMGGRGPLVQRPRRDLRPVGDQPPLRDVRRRGSRAARPCSRAA